MADNRPCKPCSRHDATTIQRMDPPGLCSAITTEQMEQMEQAVADGRADALLPCLTE